MKVKAGVLLSHLGLLSLVAAKTPVFTADNPDTYISGSATSDVQGSAIVMETEDGLKITFGPDVSKKLLELDCTEYTSSECREKTAEAMGAGKSDGLQKRMNLSWMGTGGPYLTKVAEILWTWSSGFKIIDDPSKYHVITMHIPHDQADEISQWGPGDGTFEFAPASGESTIVELEASQKNPDDVPSIEEEDNGDIKITFPSMKADIEAQWNTAICARDTKRSLHKRWTPRCLARLVEAVLRDAQVGGNLAPMQYIKPGFFPKPNNQLLVETYGEVEEYSKDLVLFKGLAAEARGGLTEFVTWMTYADHVGRITINEDGTMVIPKKFLDEQPSESEDEEDECWEKNSMEQPFCSDCGGDKLSKRSGTSECKGTNGKHEGCPCFVDDDHHDGEYTTDRIDNSLAVIEILMNGGGEEETEGEPEESVEKICFKQDEYVRKDTSKWRWVGRNTAANRIEEFCSLEFKDDGATREYTDGDDGRDSLKISVSYKGIDPPSRDTCIFNLRDELLDGCDHDDRLNQFNLKWGGRRTMKPSGMVFEIQPTKERIATNSPNWECNTWETRKDKDNKGKDGKELPELVDDKMMKEMCVHEAWFKGWADFDCGGSYTVDMNGSNGYRSAHDCWGFNYPCISNAIQNDDAVVMTGTHWAGSAGHTKNYLGIRCWIGFDDYKV